MRSATLSHLTIDKLNNIYIISIRKEVKKMQKLTRTELMKALYKYNGKIEDAYLDTLIKQTIIYLDKDRCEIFKEAIEIAEGKRESI